jgi:hypothetical protein
MAPITRREMMVQSAVALGSLAAVGSQRVSGNTVSPGIIGTPGTRQFFQHVSKERSW